MRRCFSEFGNRLFGRKRSQRSSNQHGSVLRHAVFARRLRCEPLEDRRMLSITLFVDTDSIAPTPDGLDWASAYDDLQSALTQASTFNSDGNPATDVDAIWIAEGTYTPAAELEPGDARSASFSLLDGVTLYGGFEGNETMLAERDWSAHVTTLSGDLGTPADNADNAYTVVYCGENIEAAIDGISINDGNADGSDDLSHLERSCGGGIYNREGTLTVTNSTLSGNLANYRGGGICNWSGTLTVTNSTISGNSANVGGGIYNGDYTYNYGTLTVTNSTLSGNSAIYRGGGIYNGDGTLTVTNSTLSGNSGGDRGGGIYNYYGTLTVTNSTLSGNSGGDRGGGIYNYSGTLTVTNSTLSGNSASSYGGGICNYYGTLTVTNSTLSDNSASSDGGGIYIIGSSSITALNNTIVAGNGASSGPDIYQDYVALSGSHNLIGDGSGQTSLVDGENGNIVGTSGNPIDPILGPLQDNDGPTLTRAPLPGSPLIDAGSDAAATNLLGLPLVTDQRGFLRHFGTVDIGAVELQPPGVPVAYDDGFGLNQGGSLVLDMLANDFCNDGSPLTAEIVDGPRHGALVDNLDGTMTYTPQGTFWGNDTFSYRAVNGSLESNVAEVFLSVVSPLSIVVTTVEDEQDGNLSSEDISLREALVDLAASRIQFSSHLFYEVIGLTMGLLSVSDVQIVGLGGRHLSIDGNGQDTVFEVNGSDSTISHLTVTGGPGSGGVVVMPGATLLIDRAFISGNTSRGIHNDGTLTVTDSTISGNYGGGIYNSFSGTLTVTNTTLSGNSANSSGGGIYNNGTLTVTGSTISSNSLGTYGIGDGGGICNKGTLTVTDSTISGNSATGNYGGGIYNNGTLTVTGSTIAGNSAIDGGGIYNSFSGTLTVTNSTLSGNSASFGGGICSRGDMLTITNSTLLGNSASIIGGGIYNSFSSTLTVTNSTISGNSARDYGGGIYNWGSSSTATLNNTIVAANVASGASDISLSSGTLSGSHNLIGDGSGQTSLVDGVDGNIVGTFESPIDPFFVRNPSDGGDGWGDDSGTPGVDESANDDYGDLRLRYGSAAINAGSNGLAVDGGGSPLVTDIAGNPRIINAIVDMGAHESCVPARLMGDANLDATVDEADKDVLAANWLKPSGSTWADGDFNGDKRVDDIDATILATNWGRNVTDQFFPGDANLDGTVNQADKTIMTGNWLMQSGASWTDGDFNGDKRVDDIDATKLATNWLRTLLPPAAATMAAAEPAAVSYDLDNNGKIDLGDLAFFASVYREQPGITTDSPYAYAADFDRSGTVDLGDLALFAANYRIGRAEPAATTPVVNDNGAATVATNWRPPSPAAVTQAAAPDTGPATLAQRWMVSVMDMDDDDDDDARDLVFATIGDRNDGLGLFDD